ncbi:MAG: electron transfer flavoprotein subunit alpha/FixB family protein [Candidatus Aminicenantes bacterium]|nr:electron transfer flavoprotein subunit alpha/FixB family protein [Candidatus Aminicenantes bacterium]
MILTYIETREGKIKKSSLEALGEASRRAAELGVPASAVVVGAGLDSFPPELAAAGAAKIFLLDNPGLAAYGAPAYAAVLADLVRAEAPAAVFFPATALGRDLAPRLAARLGVAMASDCVKIEVRDGRLVFTRPIYAGKAFLTLALSSVPALVTLRPNVFVSSSAASLTIPAAAAGSVRAAEMAAAGEVVKIAVALPAGADNGQVVEIQGADGAELDVAEAEIVVSGGRGLRAPESFALLRELAAILPKAAVGASRAAVDSGWIGHAHQVGQTGKTVSPNLYLAFGISGAIQHLAGMSSAKVIVAVNKDAEAPIFKIADYGIVGDVFQILPALKDELRKALKE